MPEDDNGNTNQTIMAFDYGQARIGVAIGNTLIKIPHPLITISGEGMYAKIDQIEPIIKQWKPSLLVVGMPDYADNPQKIQLVNTINNFAKRLNRKFNLPVKLVNESFSSAHAASWLKEQGVLGINQKSKLDQLAACSILLGYFSQN